MFPTSSTGKRNQQILLCVHLQYHHRHVKIRFLSFFLGDCDFSPDRCSPAKAIFLFLMLYHALVFGVREK